MARDLGCTVAELRPRISYAELLRWGEFYSWEIESSRKATEAANEDARLQAQVEAQLAAYRG